MNRYLILALILIGIFTSNVQAQDVIYKKNGEEIKAKVQKVTELEIEYKKFENLTGPTYNIAIASVLMIIYENGTKDIFGENEKPSQQVQTGTQLNQTASNEPTKTDISKPFNFFGIGYSDLLDGGANVIVSSYAPNKFDFMIYADIGALNLDSGFGSVYTQGINAIFGITYGLNDTVYGYGGAGVYYTTTYSSSLNIDESETYPSIGLGLGVNLKPIGFHIHVSVPDIDLDAAYLGIGVSYNWQ